MQLHDRNDQSAAEIAADLDRERANLAQTLDGLRERLSTDALIGDAVSYARARVRPAARMLDTAVRANPMAAALTGIGLAWLVLGRRSGPQEGPPALAGTRYEALTRWEDEGGPVDSLPDADHLWIAEADRLRNAASTALARIDAAARASLHPVGDIAASRAAVLADLARDTKAAMLRGLETLTAGAQSRILAARETAYAARLAATRQGARLIEERPLTAGAVALALGAAVAVALPRTASEDRVLGPERDRLLSRARDLLDQERARAADLAAQLADTVTAEVKVSARQLIGEAL